MAITRRGPWSQHEDQNLMSLVQSQGALNWVRIAQLLGTRTPKQCRERYHQNLKPNLNHDPITPEEGLMIERLVEELGKKWAEIARRLNGRSDNAVKNWWNGSQNRRKRNNHRHKMEHRLHYDNRADISAYGHSAQHYTVPRTVLPPPPPSSFRNGVPPKLNVVYHGFDTPLPSPSAYSPGSDSALSPSATSDGSSSYYPPNSPQYVTSPRSRDNLSPSLELPPLKMENLAQRPAYSPSSDAQPRLPGVHSFTSPDQQHRCLPGYENIQTLKSHLPTAPNSPVADLASVRAPGPQLPSIKPQLESSNPMSVNSLLG